MKSKKQLLKVVRLEPITTREQLIALCQATTRLTLDRDLAVLARDEALGEVRDSHDPGIESTNREIERNVSLLENWAKAHRAEEFKTKQGIVVSGCTLEFRKGTGKVVAEVSDKAAVNAILSLPDEHEDEMEELTRIKVELEKDAVKRMAKTPEGRAFLAELGLSVMVEEEFKFTPARDDLQSLEVRGSKTEIAA